VGRGASGGELPCLAALPACFGCGGSCCSSALYGPPGEAWAPSGVVNTAYEEGEGGVAGDGRFFGVEMLGGVVGGAVAGALRSRCGFSPVCAGAGGVATCGVHMMVLVAMWCAGKRGRGGLWRR
jgi:hypothetical protein